MLPSPARDAASVPDHEHPLTRIHALPAEPARDLDTNATGIGDASPRARESSADSAAALTLARRIVDLLSDKQASDILLLDIRGISLIADYFIICTAGSERQTAAILKDLSEKLLEEQGRKPLHSEGRGDSGWVLLDYGDVIVHIFSPAQREFYRLEELWNTATPVLRLQ